jgi:hypothetical protein
VDHRPLVGLDEPVGLGQVDELAQLGLGVEGALAEALARGERIAQQDQQPRQRSQHPGEQHHGSGRAERDGLGVLLAERARPHTDEDVRHQHHRTGRDQHPHPERLDQRDDHQRHQHHRDDLGGHAQQQHRVEVARRVLGQRPELGRTGAPVADQLAASSLGERGQRGIDTRQDGREDRQGSRDCQQHDVVRTHHVRSCQACNSSA